MWQHAHRNGCFTSVTSARVTLWSFTLFAVNVSAPWLVSQPLG